MGFLTKSEVENDSSDSIIEIDYPTEVINYCLDLCKNIRENAAVMSNISQLDSSKEFPKILEIFEKSRSWGMMYFRNLTPDWEGITDVYLMSEYSPYGHCCTVSLNHENQVVAITLSRVNEGQIGGGTNVFSIERMISSNDGLWRICKWRPTGFSGLNAPVDAVIYAKY